MPPKAAIASPPEPVAEAPGDEEEDQPRRRRTPVWKLGINDKTKGPDALPPSFAGTGTLRGDYMQVMKHIGAVPHPGFRPRKLAQKLKGMAPVEEKPEEEQSVFTIHSMRMDRLSCHVLGLALPEARHLKIIRFIDCRLDAQMIRLLRRGFVGQCSVECLQLDWNPLDEASLASQRGVSARQRFATELEGAAEELEAQDEAGMALAELLDGECLLEAISLRACNLAEAQVSPLATALKACPWQLRQLNLWENHIDDHAVEALAGALAEYRGLEFLGLGHNRISDDGMFKLCRAFNIEVLSDPELVQGMRTRVQQQTEVRDADAKAKAKAKAAPKGAARSLRERRFLVDELEEQPGGDAGPVWFYRKCFELKCLSLAENPIRQLSTLEKLQPFGPGRAELVVVGTPAAQTVLMRYPELSTREKKAFVFPSAPAEAPGGASDGWVLRLA